MKGLKYIALLIFGFSTIASVANDLSVGKEKFLEASEAYKTGAYETALDLFLEVDSAAEGSAINYNLGNVYFKLNNLPESILHYERALKFEPTNEDVRHNLKVVNALIVDRIESIPQSKLTLWWQEFKFSIGPSGWSWIAISLAFIAVLMALTYSLSGNKNTKRTGFFGALICLALMLSSLLLASQALTHREQSTHGIIFSDKVDVRSEPRSESTQVFVLHAGTKVRLISKDGEWFNVEIASGSKGWVQLGDLTEI